MLDPKIKLLQLRKLKHNHGLIAMLNGPLLSKGGAQTKLYTDQITKQINHAAEEFNWSPPPRARMAVSFRFFSDQYDAPEIYSLVKYYLDLLQGPVFKDDRQVQYIDASIWRSTPKTDKASSRLYVYVRRLSEYSRLLDLCAESDAFRKENGSPIIHHHLIDQEHWDDADKQCDLLRCNRIMAYDVPHHNNPFLKEFVIDFNKHHPLIFDFGSLPKRGQSKQFKEEIGSSLSKLITNYLRSNKILVPVEFDVQVPKSAAALTKDLDNIMITICSEAKKHLIDPKLFINGYRIYVADRLDADGDSGLQVKLLPAGEIESYNDRIEKAIESLEETLIDRM
ncbi:MAG: hypothetical protein CEE38_02925 [Planctomycetes bacterium B3_Pla]|nr:MAG: hypothetical protein CEE38_02925 [Planctomycetes bacterium B3_Pla]